MKKIILLLTTFVSSLGFSQSDCSNAQTVNLQIDGTETVNSGGVSGTAPTTSCNPSFYDATEISSGDWYEFTPSQDLNVTVFVAVPTDPQNEYIPSFNVYDGSCGNLTCVGGDLLTQDQQDNLLPAEVQFVASANTTYYIAFDDFYSNTPNLGTTNAFTFDVTTSTNIPGAPNPASNPVPADGATNVDVEETTDDNGDPIQQVPIQWSAPAAGSTPTGYEVYLSTDPNNLNFLGEAQANSAGSPINITGMQYDTTYYWEIVPVNGSVQASGTQVWSFTTEDNLDVEDFETVDFEFFINNGLLNISANQSFDQINIYNLSGKQIMEKDLSSNDENISIQSLANGLYLAKVQIGNQTKTFKFIK